jgi:hypothetical protein
MNDIVEIMDKPPIFTGYVPPESVVKFLQDYESFSAIKLYTNVNKLNVLGALLQGTARTAYE